MRRALAPLRNWLVSALGLLALVVGRASAQLALSADPAQEWRTLSSENFRVHYRAEQVAWARYVAERLEGVRTAVGREIGFLPQRTTDLVIDDPLNLPNGSALPLMDGPVMFFWPTPPDPASGLSNRMTWGEILAVHEFAHIAHLSRPAREPAERLEMLLPFVPRVGPVARRVPSWVGEGYATLVEGRLTGAGRPNSVWRAAVLRTWTLEGLLPAYEDLGNTDPFLGGSMRYLVGSAYLEWLSSARGDSALPQLWRRLSARVPRSFDVAFSGSFGDSPSALYGQFTTQLIEQALATRRLRSAPLAAEGVRVARLERGVGTPALAPDGKRVAIAMAPLGEPPRIEIWNTTADPTDSIALSERARMLERDPEDVADIALYPARPRAVSKLWPVRGRSHAEPRFMPDGRRLLVTRMEPLRSGAMRPDLFLWDPRFNSLTRVTHGAGIRAADPTPDGTAAAGIRCGAGSCDVVEITLATGAVRVLAAGAPDRSFAGARVSPDGRLVATAMHDGERWRIALVSRDGGAPRLIDAGDAANRHSPSWMSDGRALLVVSETGGVADLERLSLDGVAQPVTRVLSATGGPEVARSGSEAWYLTLHARGWDVRRIALSAPPLARAASIEGPLAVIGTNATPPSVSPPQPASTRPRWPIGLVQDREYGLGPRNWRLLPVGIAATIGSTQGLALQFVDPVGRLPILVQGYFGERESWRGASATLTWRGDRPVFEAQAFYVREEPSRGSLPRASPTNIDFEQAGGAVSVSSDRVVSAGFQHYGGGLLAASVAPMLGGATQRRTPRALAWMEAAHRYQFMRSGVWIIGAEVGGQVARGSTDQAGWTRAIASMLLRGGTREGVLELSGTYGRITSAAPENELFQLGGMLTSMLPGAALAQRFDDPALSPGALVGSQAARARLALVQGPLSLYYQVAAAGPQVERTREWWRVVGADVRFPVEAVPMIRLPGVEARVGAAYAFDNERARGWRGWLMLSARP